MTAIRILVLLLPLSLFGSVDSAQQQLLSMLDPSKKLTVVDEGFLEQKDVLLNMLETKLKEVRDKKKSKKERELLNSNHINGDTMTNLDNPRNIEVKYKASGVSGVGELDLLMKFGNQGKGILNFEASGISNIGKSHLDLSVGDGGINLPGLSQLFGRNNKNSTKEILRESKNNSTSSEAKVVPGAEIKPGAGVETRRNEPNISVAPSQSNADVPSSSKISASVTANAVEVTSQKAKASVNSVTETQPKTVTETNVTAEKSSGNAMALKSAVEKTNNVSTVVEVTKTVADSSTVTETASNTNNNIGTAIVSENSEKAVSNPTGSNDSKSVTSSSSDAPAVTSSASR